MSEPMNNAKFSSLFTSYQVLCHTPLTERDTLLREMVHALGPALEHGELDSVVQQVLERENDMPSVVAWAALTLMARHMPPHPLHPHEIVSESDQNSRALH